METFGGERVGKVKDGGGRRKEREEGKKEGKGREGRRKEKFFKIFFLFLILKSLVGVEQKRKLKKNLFLF